MQYCICILLTFVAAINGKSCEFDIHALKSNLPLLLKQNELIYPISQVISISDSEKITLACAGKKNRFADPKLGQSINVTCKDGKLTSDPGKAYTLEKLRCLRTQPSAIVRKTEEYCAKGSGKINEIVLEYDTNAITVFKTCYNESTLQALYAVHTVAGGYWQDVYRGTFSEDGASLIKKFKINNLYTKKTQLETVLNITKKLEMSKFFDKDYLARGHLAPAADFNYCATQAASFFYVNVEPEWQKFNSGNWVKIENQVRKLVKDLRSPVTVYTGVHGTLDLPDSNDNLHEIYLTEDQRLPVPKYFWKIVYNELTGAGLAFIGLNNIYGNSADITDLCTDICDKEGYPGTDRTNTAKGYVICCNVTEIQPQFPSMADVPEIHKVLGF